MEKDEAQKYVLITDDGHLSDEAAALMVEALLHPEITHVPETVLTHVQACRECKDKIMEVVTFLKNPDSAGELKQKLLKKAKQQRNWHFYRGKIAAVFVVFVLLAGAYFFIYKDPTFINRFLNGPAVEKQDQTARTEIFTPATDTGTDEKKAANDQGTKGSNEIKANVGRRKNTRSPASQYRVNPNLENMIGSRVRSGFFEVLGPENGSIIKEPIHFAWNKVLEKPHTLKIVNNKNQVFYMYTVQGVSFDFNETLSSGLYYWKLESQNELLYVGKFFIGQPKKE